MVWCFGKTKAPQTAISDHHAIGISIDLKKCIKRRTWRTWRIFSWSRLQMFGRKNLFDRKYLRSSEIAL